jgi:hypothetical protein
MRTITATRIDSNKFLHLARVISLTSEMKISPSLSKAMTMRLCNDHKDRAIQIAKNIVWRSVKFISNAQEEELACDMVYEHMGFDKNKHDEAFKQSWMLTYKGVIKRTLNQCRNSLTQELKKLCIKLMKEGKALPKPEVIVQCALRSAPNEWLCWYWEEAIGCVTGRVGPWNKTNKYYQPISMVKAEHNDKLPLVNPSHEAMICTVYKNNYEKWKDHVEKLKDDVNYKPKHNEGGLWTTTDSGQNEHCAWDQEGLDYYADTADAIKKDRQTNRQPRLEKEKEILAILRSAKGLQCQDERAEKRRRQAEKRALKANRQVKEPPTKKTRTMVIEEEEEEGVRSHELFVLLPLFCLLLSSD